MLIIFNGVSRLLETMQVSPFQTFPKIHVLLDLQPNQPSPSVAVAGGPPSAASQWRGIWRNAHSCWWNQLPQQQTVTWHEIAGNLEDQFTIKLSQARQNFRIWMPGNYRLSDVWLVWLSLQSLHPTKLRGFYVQSPQVEALLPEGTWQPGKNPIFSGKNNQWLYKWRHL